MNNILGIISLAMAAIIGAGFSSGKEITIFFNNTGHYGILNIVLAVIVFFFTFYYVFKLIDKYEVDNFKELVEVIANKKIAGIIQHIMSLFLLIIFWIMIAGFGAYLTQLFGVPEIVGSIILAIACYITFKFNIEGIIRISKYVIPLIILGIILLFFNTPITYTIDKSSDIPILKGMTSGIIYASYNIVIAIPIMIAARSLIRNKAERVISSIGICVVLAVLITFIFLLNNTFIFSVASLDMPLLYIASQENMFIYVFYIIMICLAIYTTAISAGYTVISKYSNNKKLMQFLSIVICALGIVVSKINFSVLVEYCFSWIGYIGLIEIYLIIKKANKRKKIE